MWLVIMPEMAYLTGGTERWAYAPPDGYFFEPQSLELEVMPSKAAWHAILWYALVEIPHERRQV